VVDIFRQWVWVLNPLVGWFSWDLGRGGYDWVLEGRGFCLEQDLDLVCSWMGIGVSIGAGDEADVGRK
jgi:hypothetical protein